MANGYDDPRSTVLCDADKDCWLYDRFNNDKDDDELQDDGNDSDVTVRATALIQGGPRFTTSGRFVVTTSSTINLLRKPCFIIPKYGVKANLAWELVGQRN